MSDARPIPARLRRPEHADLAVLVDWMRDPELVRMILGEHTPSIRQFREQILSILTGGLGPALSNTGHFILESGDGTAMGMAAFSRTSWRNRSAYYDVYVRDEFISHEALLAAYRLTIEFGFDELNLYRSTVRVPGRATDAHAVLLELGAQREAVLRQHVLRDGSPEDLYVFGVLRRDFAGERVP
jgi:ribosomal-protein-alanine N-acetyltransferase